MLVHPCTHLERLPAAARVAPPDKRLVPVHLLHLFVVPSQQEAERVGHRHCIAQSGSLRTSVQSSTHLELLRHEAAVLARALYVVD